MKRILFTSVAFFNILAAMAQPVIQKNIYSQSVGRSYHYYSKIISSFNPGSSGANVLWDFSSETFTSPGDYSVVTANKVANSTLYPETKIVTVSTGPAYEFLDTSANSVARVGVESSGYSFKYSNSHKYLVFPISYNSSFTDTYANTYTTSVPMSRTGNYSCTCDGYGTLKVLGAIHENVLRLKCQDYITDTYTIQGFPGIVQSSQVNYLWVKQSFGGVLLSYSSTTSGGQPFYSMTAMSEKVLGLEDENVLNASNQVLLHPNPATGNGSTVTFNAINSGDYSVSLIDPLGDVTEIAATSFLSNGVHHFEIPTNKLSKGIYFVKVKGSGKSFNSKLVIE